MSDLGDDIRHSREMAVSHTLIKIEPYSNSKDFAFILRNDYNDIRISFSSSTPFGDWLTRLKFKIGDRIKISFYLSGDISFAEAYDTKR